eukprot:9018744-Pyramimonas_sp.AAC.1
MGPCRGTPLAKRDTLRVTPRGLARTLPRRAGPRAGDERTDPNTTPIGTHGAGLPKRPRSAWTPRHGPLPECSQPGAAAKGP